MRGKITFLLLFSMAGCLAMAGEPQVAIVPLESWSNVFGGRETNFHFSVTANTAIQGRVGWNLVMGNLPVSRREQAIALEPGQAVHIELPLPIPDVKAGVVMRAVLSINVMPVDAEKALVSLDKTIWIFPEDAFADRREWLKSINIFLFDPEKKTAACFEKAQIPFQPIHNVDALAEIKAGLLIIGEGVSFKDYGGLGAALYRAAANGLPVLCLAPAGGSLGIAGTGDSDLPAPRSLCFNRSDIITRLDKRLDAAAWPPDGVLSAGELVLRADRGRIIGAIESGGAGWPWLEATFAAQHGKLLVCCFRIIDKWESGPTPRYLLARILESLSASGGPKAPSSSEKE